MIRFISLPLICFASIAFIVIATALVISEPQYRIALSGTDFRGQYTGAYMVREGALPMLYSIDAQYTYQKQFLPELTKPYLMVYSYHPLIAIILAPIGFLSFGIAYRVLLAINGMLLYGIIHIITPRLLDATKKDSGFPYIYTVFAFFLPVWFALLQNQFTFILFIIYFLVWNAVLDKKNDTHAGLLLSFLLIKPHYLIVPALVFLALRRWNIIKGILMGGIMLTLVTMLVFGRQTIFDYVQFLLHLTQAGDAFTIHTAAEPTFKGMIHAVLKTDRLPWYATGGYLLVCIALVARLIRLHKYAARNPEKISLWYAGVILVSLITSPHTNYHDLMLMLFFPFLVLRFYKKTVRPAVLFTYPARHKIQWYALCFCVFLTTVVWVFVPSIAVVSTALMIWAADRILTSNHLYPFTRRSILKRK